MHRKGATNGAGITLVISNEDMEEIIKITKFLEDLNLMIHGISQTVESEIIWNKVSLWYAPRCLPWLIKLLKLPTQPQGGKISIQVLKKVYPWW